MKYEDEAVAHFQKGWVFHGKNQFDEAVNEYTRAIELSPGNPVN